ncbi:hypothetical protein ACTSKR_14685 [Chitinibacteraceae bacterium HSL-7]
MRCAYWLLLAAAPVAYAAEPQATPPQCLSPEEGGIAETGGDFDFEACLIKAGNQNFVRKGKTLTIRLAKGTKKFVSKLTEDESNKAFSYGGYDVASGFHIVNGSGSEWSWDELVQHGSGESYALGGNLLPGGISPDRHWVFAGSGEPSCGNELYAQPLSHDKKGNQAEATNLTELASSCGEEGKPAAYPVRAEWPASGQARVSWRCDSGGNEFDDQTTLTFANGKWSTDRRGCAGGKAVAQEAGKNAVSPQGADWKHNGGKLAVGMSVAEVEVLMGSDAHGYQVDPFAYLGKKKLTRYWKVDNRKLLVDFEDDKVTGWRF